MSIETWKAEFYPIEADKVPEELAVEHSLRKWRGLTKENLERHELCLSNGYLKIKPIPGVVHDCDDIVFGINAMTCSLCFHYLRYGLEAMNCYCEKCPLFSHLGKSCSQGSQDDLYWSFLRSDDPLPMIAALEAVAAKTPAIKAMKRPTKNQIDMMRHALGADGRAPGYRNHFAAEPDDAEINVLVELGLMRRGYDIPGGLRYFHVTEAGQEMVGIKEQ